MSWQDILFAVSAIVLVAAMLWVGPMVFWAAANIP